MFNLQGIVNVHRWKIIDLICKMVSVVSSLDSLPLHENLTRKSKPFNIKFLRHISVEMYNTRLVHSLNAYDVYAWDVCKYFECSLDFFLCLFVFCCSVWVSLRHLVFHKHQFFTLQWINLWDVTCNKRANNEKNQKINAWIP